MLFVFIKQVVENLLVEQGDSLKVIATSGLEADDLVDESVGLVAEVSDVLLALNLLFNIGGIVTDLQFNRIQRWRVLLL